MVRQWAGDFRFNVVLAKHIERLKAQGVCYAEIMIASSADVHPDGMKQVRALREWAKRCEAGEIQVEFLVCIGRNRTPEEAEARAGVILSLYQYVFADAARSCRLGFQSAQALDGASNWPRRPLPCARA